jgi:PLP dependent protein
VDLADRLAEVDAGIADAARAAGRDASSITRIVVTKFHPASLVEGLYGLGVRDVGENRQQELSEKVATIGGRDGLRWHFIGQAQTNKAKAIRAAASVVHSLDRSKIADALDAAGGADDPVLDVLIQVNLTDDPGRGGVAERDLEALTEHVSGCGTLRLRGVMAVAPLDESPVTAFERLAGFSARVRSVDTAADWISAGMTADYPDAIAAGATHLRIGSAITGLRPLHP